MKTFALKNASNEPVAAHHRAAKHVPVSRGSSAFPGRIPYIQRKPACPCDGGCPRCSNGGVIQPKLTIGAPNDKYEQEADRVADRVMRMPGPEQSLVNGHSSVVQRKAGCSSCGSFDEEEQIQTKAIGDQITPLVQRQAEEEPEEEEEPVQAKSLSNKSSPQAAGAGLHSRIQSMRGGGQPLSAPTRAFFEPRFGKSFNSVRVHTGANAAETAKSVNAKAFTIGKNVVFGAGQFQPATTEGRRLLAHELTHVVQQAHGRSIRLRPVSNLQKTAVDHPGQVLYHTQLNTLQRKSCPEEFREIKYATWFHCGEAGARNLACAVCTAAGKRDCNCSNIVKTLGHSKIIAPSFKIAKKKCGGIFELTVPGRTDPPIEVTQAERPGGVELDIHRDVIPLLGLSVDTGRYTVCLRNTGRRNNRVMKCGPAKCTPPEIE